MASGWGEEDAKGGWYAAQDFNLKTLRIRAGARLPDGWQVVQNVKYLQQMFGKDCVTRKSQADLSDEIGSTPELSKMKRSKVAK